MHKDDEGSPIRILQAGGFSAGDLATYPNGKNVFIVDFVQATDRWGLPINGFEALVYDGGLSLRQINTDFLKHVE